MNQIMLETFPASSASFLGQSPWKPLREVICRDPSGRLYSRQWWCVALTSASRLIDRAIVSTPIQDASTVLLDQSMLPTAGFWTRLLWFFFFLSHPFFPHVSYSLERCFFMVSQSCEAFRTSEHGENRQAWFCFTWPRKGTRQSINWCDREHWLCRNL